MYRLLLRWKKSLFFIAEINFRGKISKKIEKKMDLKKMPMLFEEKGQYMADDIPFILTTLASS